MFADRPALWTDHLFEGLLEWVNESLARAKWLALFGDPEHGDLGAAAAGRRSLANAAWRGPEISFAWITGKRSREPRDEEPPILVPCRTG